MKELHIPKSGSKIPRLRNKNWIVLLRSTLMNLVKTCFVVLTRIKLRNIYILGIIQVSLCYTIPLNIPSDLKASDPITSIFNLQEKTYQEDKKIWKNCDLKTMQLIYEYQQKEHIKLMNELQQIPLKYHNLPFISGFPTIHCCIYWRLKFIKYCGTNNQFICLWQL